MASASGAGVLADVQRQLAAGWSDEDVLAALTAKGLSRASAERFLQRARPSGPVPPPLPAEAPTVVLDAPQALPVDGPPPIPSAGPPPLPAGGPAATPPDAPSTGSRLGVIGGSIVMTLGLVFLAWALGQERVRIRLPLALTFSGAAWMFSAARGLVDLRQPATWVLPGSAAAVPAIAALAVVGAVLTTGAPTRSDDAGPGAGPIAERRDRAAALAVRAKETREGAIAAHVDRLRGARTGDPCQAAYALAELGAREQVPDLVRFLEEATEDERKICAAYALVRLGEGSAMLPRYVEWSRAGSEQLVHGAIVGFGHIGPSAAHEAVPVLQDALTSSPSAARRWVVVASLAKLGPTAAPVLQLVVDDEDAQVRTAAQQALEKLR